MGLRASKCLRHDDRLYITYMICINNRPWVLHLLPHIIPTRVDIPKKLFRKIRRVSKNPIVLATILVNLSSDVRFPLTAIKSIRRRDTIYSIKYYGVMRSFVQVGAINVHRY